MGKLKHSPKCPSCGIQLDGYTAVAERPVEPKDGDLTVCVYCAQVLAFTGDQHLRLATLEETASVADDPRMQAALQIAGAVRRARQWRN